MTIDVHDPQVYLRGVPHETFTWLRENDPVHWHAEPGGPGFWALTRHSDLVRVSLDTTTFSSHLGGAMLEDYDPEELAQHRMLMLNQDPPEHGRLRAQATGGFSADAVTTLTKQLRVLCDGLFDQVGPAFDFSARIAGPYAYGTYAELLGAPPEDRATISGWIAGLTGVDGPREGRTVDDVTEVATAIFGYAHDGAVQRRGEVLSLLAETMSPGNIALLFIQLANSGTEAPRHLASGSVQAFLEHPGAWERLRTDPGLLDSAVEECLRWVSPVIYCRRTATADVELGGRTIRAGDKVVGFYSAAHRDPAVFPDPFRFDISRSPNPQIDFGGGGPHRCLGARLARAQLRILLETLLDRAPDLRADGPAVRLASNAINGVLSLPVARA